MNGERKLLAVCEELLGYGESWVSSELEGTSAYEGAMNHHALKTARKQIELAYKRLRIKKKEK